MGVLESLPYLLYHLEMLVMLVRNILSRDKSSLNWTLNSNLEYAVRCFLRPSPASELVFNP